MRMALIFATLLVCTLLPNCRHAASNDSCHGFNHCLTGMPERQETTALRQALPSAPLTRAEMSGKAFRSMDLLKSVPIEGLEAKEQELRVWMGEMEALSRSGQIEERLLALHMRDRLWALLFYELRRYDWLRRGYELKNVPPTKGFAFERFQSLWQASRINEREALEVALQGPGAHQSAVREKGLSASDLLAGSEIYWKLRFEHEWQSLQRLETLPHYIAPTTSEMHDYYFLRLLQLIERQRDLQVVVEFYEQERVFPKAREFEDQLDKRVAKDAQMLTTGTDRRGFQLEMSYSSYANPHGSEGYEVQLVLALCPFIDPKFPAVATLSLSVEGEPTQSMPWPEDIVNNLFGIFLPNEQRK